MCRSIKTLRPPYAEQVTDTEIRAAALQYVRKISGFRAPAGHNAVAFTHAVDAGAAGRLVTGLRFPRGHRPMLGTARPAPTWG